MRSEFSVNNILRGEKKSFELRVEPPSPQLLGFQSSRGSRRNKKAIKNEVIIGSLISRRSRCVLIFFKNPDFE